MQEKQDNWTQDTLDVLKSRVRLARFGIHLLTLPIPKIRVEGGTIKYLKKYGGQPIKLQELHERAISSGGCPVESFYGHINIGNLRALVPLVFRVELDVYMMQNRVEDLTEEVIDNFLFHSTAPWEVRDSIFDWPEYGVKEAAYRIMHAINKSDWLDENWLLDLPMEHKVTGLFTSKKSILNRIVKRCGELEFQRCLLDWTNE